MVILHKDGVMIELAALEKIRPHSINITNGKLIIEIRFLSGERETYEDSWITKTGGGPINIRYHVVGEGELEKSYLNVGLKRKEAQCQTNPYPRNLSNNT